MDHFKAFIAGIVVPSIILPFGLYFAASHGNHQVLGLTSLHFLPLVWGLWNVLYFAFFKNFFKDQNIRLLVTGAVLGFLVAAYAVYHLHIGAVLGHPQLHYLPLVVAPIVYALLWRFAVKPVNDLVGLQDK